MGVELTEILNSPDGTYFKKLKKIQLLQILL